MDLKGIFNGTNVSIFSVILVIEFSVIFRWVRNSENSIRFRNTNNKKKKYIKHKKIANYNSYLDIDISVACILLKDEILILKNKNTCISSDFSKHLCCILRIFKNNLWNEFPWKFFNTFLFFVFFCFLFFVFCFLFLFFYFCCVK